MAGQVEYDVECGLCLNEESKELIQCLCGYYVCFDCQRMMKKLYCPNCNKEVTKTYIYKLIAEDDPLVIDHLITKRYRHDASSKNEAYSNQLLFETVKKSLLKGRSFNVNIVGKCPACNKVMICNSSEPDVHRCTKCNSTVCSYCEEPHPKDQQCNKDVVESLKELRKTSRKCPGCFVYVAKEDGCDHMRCLSCGTQFSWESGKKHKDFDYLTKRDNNVVYKPSTEVMELEVVKVTPVHVVKKSKLTDRVSDFIDSLKVKIENNIKNMTEKLSDLIEEEYKNDRDESSYETILSRIPMVHKKKLYDNILVAEYVESIEKNASKEDIVDLYQRSPIPQRYRISWDDIIRFITATVEVKNLKGDVVKDKKDVLMKPLNYKQEEHVKNILERLRELGTCIDTSKAGSGKTYTALLTAVELKMKKVFIVCPVTMGPKWSNVISSYKQTADLEFMVKTYSTLIESSLKKSGLVRIENDGTKIIIHLSDSFKKWLSKNAMIIIDESHNIKKASSFGFKFISALSSFAIENNIPKIAMSATPTTSMIDSLSFIKKLIPDNEIYNKRLILKFPRFMRYTFTEDDERALRSTDEMIQLALGNINNIGRYFKAVSSQETISTVTYIPRSILRYNEQGSDIFERTLIKQFENAKFLELLKNLVTLEKYADFRSESFWIDNFCSEDINQTFLDEQAQLLLIDPEVVEKDVAVINSINNANARFNCLIMYFGFITGKNGPKNKKNISMVNKATFVQLLQYFFFLYGTPIRYCSHSIMSRITREKIITIILNRHIVNFNNIPDNGEGFVDHSENLKLYRLKLDMSDEDNNRMNTLETEFSVEHDNKILSINLQCISKMVFNLQLSEPIVAGYIYDIVKQMRNGKRNMVIAFSYNNTAEMIMEKCTEDRIPYYLINGSVKDKQEVIDKFQRESGCFLLVNLASLNSGVDLDDKVGNCERYVFIIPNHDITKMTQFMFRFQRADSRSNSKVFIAANQLRIIESMNKKLNFIKNFETSFSVFNGAEEMTTPELIEKFV